MKMLVMNRKRIVSVLMTVLVSISVFVVGCGEMDDDTEVEFVNKRPSIGAIPDQKVDVADTVEVNVIITDPDAGDTHTVSASSNNTNVVTVSVSGTTLTIKGVAAGTAMLTVSATDNSGQDNAAAIPVTFTFTVIVNSQPAIGAIPDQKVDEGDTVEVEVRITDLDPDDIHTISASSNDTDVATVSVTETTLSVEGIAEGTVIIEVVATDDSGQDNAASIPVTFNITVIENLLVPKDPAYSDLLKAWENGDDDLVEELFNRAKKLRAGLEFPRDTFAINEEQTILVAHTPKGTGLVLIGRSSFEVGGDMQLGWLTYVKRGNIRVLTHYDP